MPYHVELTPSAVKDLAALPSKIQRQVGARIDALAQDPRPDGVKKLRGGRNEYRLRSGDFRILYQVHDDRIVVVVVRIADRKDAYWDR
ncbi:MAG TPA: type II toxin-antitoxin system RelE/ParE family toxin [Gemmatimonadales bacterium]|nr:type II toxin-antitoxin system RelE/ParE family toxin [Gemmatimonadales bacterium]